MTSQPLEVRQRNVGPWQMNTYALVCPTTQASVLIDPGDDPDILPVSYTHLQAKK